MATVRKVGEHVLMLVAETVRAIGVGVLVVAVVMLAVIVSPRPGAHRD